MSYWPSIIESRRKVKKYTKKIQREQKVQHQIMDKISLVVFGKDE